MVMWHGESGKKLTGGKIQLARKKRKYELGGEPVYPKIGNELRKIVRIKGGDNKVKLSSLSFVNVVDMKTRTAKKVKILDVVTNPANPDLARRKVVTRGAVINTEIGKARITSRPSQHGIANAVLLEQ
ncbi:MAG: 30S ribosomal protein S8e [Candidatus Aenigmarchaeota archaeon]|nr:30S ribosomal protein S8e [Candidatus Aenigmarchaeota archaeon]